MRQSCFFSGFQFLPLPSVGKVPSHRAIQLQGSWGSSWRLSSLPVFSLSCLLPPATPPRSQRHGEGTCCPCLIRGQPADYRCGGLQVGGEVSLGTAWLAAPGYTARHPRGLPFLPQMAKQSLRPFCTICNRYFKTPRKFVEHVKSQEHKDKAKEVTPAPSEDMAQRGTEPWPRPHCKLRFILDRTHSRSGGIGSPRGVRCMGCGTWLP